MFDRTASEVCETVRRAITRRASPWPATDKLAFFSGTVHHEVKENETWRIYALVRVE